jgi:hypothetical protein
MAGGGTFRGAFGWLVVTDTLGGAGFVWRSSLELQLEIPNAAMSDSTTTVAAMRAGVHKGLLLVFDFFNS